MSRGCSSESRVWVLKISSTQLSRGARSTHVALYALELVDDRMESRPHSRVHPNTLAGKRKDAGWAAARLA